MVPTASQDLMRRHALVIQTWGREVYGRTYGEGVHNKSQGHRRGRRTGSSSEREPCKKVVPGSRSLLLIRKKLYSWRGGEGSRVTLTNYAMKDPQPPPQPEGPAGLLGLL